MWLPTQTPTSIFATVPDEGELHHALRISVTIISGYVYHLFPLVYALIQTGMNLK